MTGFVEVADRVFVLRQPVLDVNVTLVLGDGQALVVDTLSTDAQAGSLLADVRELTPLPLTIVNTHFHFDHSFGNAVLAAGGRPIWAHASAATQLGERGSHWQHMWYQQWQAEMPALADGLAAVTLCPPTSVVHDHATVDLGGREVRLSHLGRGHTDGDLVVLVPDAGVAVVGDLVEESGPPDFADGYPLEWPDTLATLLALLAQDSVVVPGHGSVVGREFVAAQHGQLAELDWLIRLGNNDGAPAEQVAARSPFGRDASLHAVRRGYAELAGRV